MIGKLKKTLKERCPVCGKVLQIRVKEIKTIEEGIPVTKYIEYISCSNLNCGYEKEFEQKRQRYKESFS